MQSEYKLSTPYPTDYFSQIFANLRLVKEMFEERYTLDHHLNETDTALTDGHDKLTMKGITVNTLADKMPYPMNPTTGIAELPANGAILFCKVVNGNCKLIYAAKDNTNTLKEITLR